MCVFVKFGYGWVLYWWLSLVVVWWLFLFCIIVVVIMVVDFLSMLMCVFVRLVMI